MIGSKKTTIWGLKEKPSEGTKKVEKEGEVSKKRKENSNVQ